MAPEKIYVTESIYGNTMMQVADEESVEYINKDALLAWLKFVRANPMIPMNIDRVIEKIESM